MDEEDICTLGGDFASPGLSSSGSKKRKVVVEKPECLVNFFEYNFDYLCFY